MFFLFISPITFSVVTHETFDFPPGGEIFFRTRIKRTVRCSPHNAYFHTLRAQSPPPTLNGGSGGRTLVFNCLSIWKPVPASTQQATPPRPLNRIEWPGPGYWAEEVVSLLKAGAGQPGFTRPKVCIVSGYPEGLAPYERSEVSKECLRPANQHSRDWQVRIEKQTET